MKWVVLWSLLAARVLHQPTQPVRTRSGLVRGAVSRDGKLFQYFGIPYATVDESNRFQAPLPPPTWTGIFEAVDENTWCPQNSGGIPIGEPNCLKLNVYTPVHITKPLPVMVFIHGGGYKSGSGNDDHYGPDFLMPHGVVLVTLNYRLDALGFLCLDTEEVPGNAGLKDQVAALRWVRDNIASFGGDPKNVTVFGESAGGASTCLHILSPMSKGLFQRAIPMSGSPLCDWSLAFMPQKRAFALGKILGFDTNDPDKLLEFLQSLPVEKLIDTSPTVMSFEEYSNNILKLYHFTPVVEKDFGQEHFLTEEPLEAMKNKRINDVDVLIGHTSEETTIGIAKFEQFFLQQYNRYPELVVPRKILMKCNPETVLEISKRIHDYYFKGKLINKDSMREFVSYANYACFIYDIYRFLSHLPKVGNRRRYMYKFSCVSGRNVYGSQGLKYGIKGAAHLDDLMYLLNANVHNVEVKRNTKEYELIQLACTVFTNFAKHGTPTPDSSLGIIWPEYDNSSKAYVAIEDTLVPKTVENEDLDFWKSNFEYCGLEF
uniref:Carboxylic ester hydrolase n=1 Tax=Helicoverpa armigera TaxID=29058 RepID=A0A291P0Q3_HELAM|nr:acetate esterase 6 [Helicoverpa armigera]